MHDVVVYSRKGCHLCDIVKETLTQIQGEVEFQWRAVDIDADPQLRQKYNDQVPVVFIDDTRHSSTAWTGISFCGCWLGESKTKNSPR